MIAAEEARLRQLDHLISLFDPPGTATPTHPLSTPVCDLDASPPKPLRLGRLDPIEHTILFGPGGVGKGALACSYIKGLVSEGEVVLVLDYEDHGGEWARRLDGLGADTSKVHWMAPFKVGLKGFLDAKSLQAIKAEVEALGATYIVIDSIVIACAGHDVIDSATPSLYSEALQMIGLPGLSLAHVNRQHDVRYPFGSVFWHNLGRVTWSLMDKGGDVLLICQKASNYGIRGRAFTVAFTWWDDMLREVDETRASVTLLSRITSALADGPLSVADIGTAINEGLPLDEHTKANNIRSALSRELKRGVQQSAVTKLADERWALRGAE